MGARVGVGFSGARKDAHGLHIYDRHRDVAVRAGHVEREISFGYIQGPGVVHGRIIADGGRSVRQIRVQVEIEMGGVKAHSDVPYQLLYDMGDSYICADIQFTGHIYSRVIAHSRRGRVLHCRKAHNSDHSGVIRLPRRAVFPSLSSSASGRDVERFRSSTKKFLGLSIFLSLSVLVPMAIFGTDVIKMIVGSEYSPAGTPLKIMAAALLFILFNLPFSTGLIASGHEKDVLKQAFASAVLSVSSNFILMPRYGMIGGSISFLLAESLALIWILILYRSRIINPLTKAQGFILSLSKDKKGE